MASFSVLRRTSPQSAHHTWFVTPADLGADERASPALLLSRAFDVATSLGLERPDVAAVSVEDLQWIAPVRAGATLQLTVAIERDDAAERVVSVVIRHGPPAARRGLVALGVLRFSFSRHAAPATSDVLRTSARRAAPLGLTPIELRFHAGVPSAGLADAGLLLRVQETSLVSAQGFLGGAAAFEAVHGLSLLAPTRAGQRLRLRCSVVRAEGRRVSVLSHVADDASGEDVLCALTSFHALARVSPVAAPAAVPLELEALFHKRRA